MPSCLISYFAQAEKEKERVKISCEILYKPGQASTSQMKPE